jgi:hypothetical protein
MPIKARGLLADVNAQRHLRVLLWICEGRSWRYVWNDVRVPAMTFGEIGLPLNVKDDMLWQACQSRGLLLITQNRNRDGPDSLEAAIKSGGVDSLPVLTIADGARLLSDAEYAERAAARLMEILLDLDRLLGCGRLYLPADAS